MVALMPVNSFTFHFLARSFQSTTVPTVSLYCWALWEAKLTILTLLPARICSCTVRGLRHSVGSRALPPLSSSTIHLPAALSHDLMVQLVPLNLSADADLRPSIRAVTPGRKAAAENGGATASRSSESESSDSDRPSSVSSESEGWSPSMDKGTFTFSSSMAKAAGSTMAIAPVYSGPSSSSLLSSPAPASPSCSSGASPATVRVPGLGADAASDPAAASPLASGSLKLPVLGSHSSLRAFMASISKPCK
mmetsp:Transcript_76473/g.137984  ORF Transcript_76473/g.137984 Transcript_76473/m.137984 type:complete len:250 (+) Transcript_76473:59-808(+)